MSLKLDTKLHNSFQRDLIRAAASAKEKNALIQRTSPSVYSTWEKSLKEESIKQKTSIAGRSYEQARDVEKLVRNRSTELSNKTFEWIKQLMKVSTAPISLDRRYDVALLLRSRDVCIRLFFENKFPAEILDMTLSYLGNDLDSFSHVSKIREGWEKRLDFIEDETPLLEEYIKPIDEIAEATLESHLATLTSGGDTPEAVAESEASFGALSIPEIYQTPTAVIALRIANISSRENEEADKEPEQEVTLSHSQEESKDLHEPLELKEAEDPENTDSLDDADPLRDEPVSPADETPGTPKSQELGLT